MAFDGLMKGKRGLVMGVANQHSIAWGIAQALHGAGAELAFSYQGDLFRKRARGGSAEDLCAVVLGMDHLAGADRPQKGPQM